jgi:hypothetical protein
MNHATKLSRKAFSLGLAAFVFTVCGLVSQSPAQIITLVNNNSIAQIDTGSQAGMFNWVVDGQNQLAQQWFWYRVGGVGPEASINTISAPSIVLPNPKAAFITYNNGAYSVEVDYLLNGSAPGSGQSDIGESITINNTSGGALNFHFFQYSDFDLSATPGGEIVTLSTNQFGLVNQVDQQDATMTLQETVATPGANHGEGAFFPTTLNALNDALPTTLSGALGPVGPGDVTWALEWDLTIPDGQSALISKDKRLQLIPEPSTLALVSLGLVALGLQKRRRSA